MRFLRLTIAYDGTNFAGWQIQPKCRTVQETLELALQKITGQPVRTVASGRTDAGVHALGQVASCRTNCALPVDVLRRALNAHLPHDVAVLVVDEAPLGFHALRDAVSKRYRYQLQDGRVRDVFRRHIVWQYSEHLDDRAMHRAAQSLVGTHDFSSFESAGSPRATSVRTILELGVARDKGRAGDQITIDVVADGFLYNMVRTIVGTLVEVGRGARPESWSLEVLQAKDRRRAGPTAPPQGLLLVDVNYDAARGGAQAVGRVS